MAYLLSFSSYLAGSKALSSARPSDTDTMTNTVLEAIASSGGKNGEIGIPYYMRQCVARPFWPTTTNRTHWSVDIVVEHHLHRIADEINGDHFTIIH